MSPKKSFVDCLAGKTKCLGSGLLTLIAVLLLICTAACGQAAGRFTPTPAATATTNPTATVWPPAGTIAFGMADPTLENDDIFFIQTDGTGLKRLTDNHASTESPAWSPDGSKIAYHFLPMNGSKAIWPDQLWVMNTDGTDQTQLTHDPIVGSYPGWSFDRKQIVYNSWFHPFATYGPAQIYIMNADGSDIRRLTNGPDNDMFPTFAPDGKIHPPFSTC